MVLSASDREGATLGSGCPVLEGGLNLAQNLDRLAGRIFGAPHYERQVTRELARYSGSPIFVWQMGKVGSTSIEEAVMRTTRDAPFFRAHLLNPDLLRRGEMYRRARARGTREYLRSDALRRALLAADEGWKIVTVVREPMARNLSAFFQNLDVYLGYDSRKTIESLDATRVVPFLRDAFVDGFDHDRPAEWFDYEIRDLLGLDVLELPFEPAAGTATYRSGFHELLVIRMESLAPAGERALIDFLRNPEIKLGRGNDADMKWYSRYYRAVRAEAHLPLALVDRVYGSRYARTFYSSEELERYRSEWLG